MCAAQAKFKPQLILPQFQRMMMCRAHVVGMAIFPKQWQWAISTKLWGMHAIGSSWACSDGGIVFIFRTYVFPVDDEGRWLRTAQRQKPGSLEVLIISHIRKRNPMRKSTHGKELLPRKWFSRRSWDWRLGYQGMRLQSKAFVHPLDHHDSYHMFNETDVRRPWWFWKNEMALSSICSEIVWDGKRLLHWLNIICYCEREECVY